jgi:uncharacterized damage-inducible protein DinB
MLDAALRLQYQHHAWALSRLLDAAEQVSAEQRAIQGHAGRGSIHDTLRHILEVQDRWIAVFNGETTIAEAMQNSLDPESVAELAVLRSRLEDTNARTLAFLSDLTADDLNRDLLIQTPWTPDKVVPLWSMLLHVLSEGAQHRSEVAAMLTEQGSSPGPLDLAFYILVPENNAEL